ncbi:hypothetical protein ACFVHI_36335 [Kitasatospora sp. NPDC127121]|uniref:hypothetical protein n=1 Tax=Kitasatospora sp. NPDC127121 TaxID=3345371 RepID=UPI0036320D6D
MKRLALRLFALLVTVMLGLTAAATPSVASPASERCSAEVDTSSNYQYRCEFGIFPLADIPAGGAVKNGVFQLAVTHFSDYFPFSGCGDVLKVNQTCALMPGNAPVQVTEIGSNYYILKSLKGHPEGENRYIKFAVYIIDNELRLGILSWGEPSVVAKATVSFGGATALWGGYARNLTKTVYP